MLNALGAEEMRRSGVRVPPGAEVSFFNLFIAIEMFPKNSYSLAISASTKIIHKLRL